MTILRLTLFGKPHIYLDDEPFNELVSAKARAILFYLAVTQERTSRETLAGLLWSDMPESSARGSLRVALSKLRHAFGSHLHIGRRNVALRTADLWVDVAAFEAEVDGRAAVALYQGPFLNDFYLRDAPLFDQWVETERQRLHQHAIDLLSQLAEKAAAQGDLTQAIHDCRHLLALEPWREETHRQLMQLLAHSGQRGAALAQYNLCCQALQEKLDASPAAETVALYQQIKAGHLPAPVPSFTTIATSPISTAYPHNLPSAVTSFIGRDDELQQALALLSGPPCRLLTVTGTGGIGKTRLALETAPHLLPHFAQGVYYVPLVALNTADLLAPTIAQHIGLTLQGHSEPRQQLLNYLSHKQQLLILDNFEHLFAGADLLLEMLTAAPQLKLLITSRAALGLAEEWVLPLSGLPFTEQATTAALLFNARAQRLDLSFDATQEAAAVQHICTLVEGLPLAIELAAAWVRLISCAEIAAEIQRNLDFLATDLAIVPAHQPSMRAVFAYSWSLLPDEVQAVFARLAIFRGSFTRHAAEQVAGASLRTLSTLVDKSLLQKESHGRLHIHPLLQQFGLEKLDTAAHHAIATAHARYYASFLQTREPDMYSGRDLDVVAEIQAEIENIRAAWAWLSTKPQTELIEQLLPMSGYYLQRRCHYQEGHKLFSDLLHTAADLPPLTTAQIQLQLATFECQLSRFEQAAQHLQQAIPIFQQADAVANSAQAFYYLGFIATRTGDYTQAITHFQDSLALFDAIADDKGRTQPLNGLGIVCATQGDYTQAEHYYRQTLAIFRHYGYQRGIANVLSNLGSVYGRQEQYHEARRYYEEAAAQAKVVGEQMITAVILSNLGSVSRALKEYDTAVRYYEESLPITQEIGDQRWVAANHNGLGLTYQQMGRPQKAQAHMRLALQTAAAVHALPDALTALNQLGRVLLHNGQLATAATTLIFVAQHPATPDFARQEAQQSLTALTPQLSEAQKKHSRAQAQTATFEEMVEMILEKQTVENIGKP